MLDDRNVLNQRDPQGALQVAANQYQQAIFDAKVMHPEHDNREITKVVIAGMGGSALAGLVVKTWLKNELTVPFEVVRSYDLPAYVDFNTLVIVSSYSGNTEETLSMLAQAKEKQAQVAIIAAGGALIDRAHRDTIAHVMLPDGLQPRTTVILGLRAVTALLVHFGVISVDRYDEIADASQWLKEQASSWLLDVTTDKNDAKQLALMAVGKTAVIYGGSVTSSLAYKWKISWNENAKNVAFYGELPEFNHNEFIGWSSHPVEKPFVVFDLVSSFENPRVLTRFDISDRLLSGKRPKAVEIRLKGETMLQQLLWGTVLADFVSIYVAIVNGVDPTPVALIEKLKVELA